MHTILNQTWRSRPTGTCPSTPPRYCGHKKQAKSGYYIYIYIYIIYQGAAVALYPSRFRLEMRRGAPSVTGRLSAMSVSTCPAPLHTHTYICARTHTHPRTNFRTGFQQNAASPCPTAPPPPKHTHPTAALLPSGGAGGGPSPPTRACPWGGASVCVCVCARARA